MNEGFSCDRRLSRAARALLHSKLRTSPAALNLNQDDAKDNSSKDQKLWRLLDSILLSSNNNSNNSTTTTCPLLPHLDAWKGHEEHSTVIPADTRVIPKQRTTGFTTARFALKYAQSTHPYWYKCLYCQKVFSSRYYLDVHQATHHYRKDTKNNHQTNNRTTMICPATDWCPFLSPTACHHQALQDEPYYDRGSAGRRSSDRYRVEAKLWKQAHATRCTAAAVAKAVTACRAVGEACFVVGHDDNNNNNNDAVTRMATFWQTHVCDKTALSCPNRLQQLYFRTQQDGDLMLRQVHEWQDDWRYWSQEHHTLGWMGRILFVLIILFYLYKSWQRWQKYRHGRRAGPRLLRPKAKKL